MPKTIIVFSDDTGQDGGTRPERRVSNVYKMDRACKFGPETCIAPAKQMAFCDPADGLGPYRPRPLAGHKRFKDHYGDGTPA